MYRKSRRKSAIYTPVTPRTIVLSLRVPVIIDTYTRPK